MLKVCDLHMAPDYPIILKFDLDSTVGEMYDVVSRKLKYAWKEVPRIEKFVPHLVSSVTLSFPHLIWFSEPSIFGTIQNDTSSAISDRQNGMAKCFLR